MSSQTRITLVEVVVLIDGNQFRLVNWSVDYPSEWRMNAPPWPDNAPHRPSIICAVALSDCPKDRRMWQKAESLETERQTRPSGGVNRLVNYPSGQTRHREVDYPSGQTRQRGR